ncbi:MAG: acyl-CoA thioesterase [Ferruginibacter sp.]
MESIISKVEIRWADLDPNFHVLHSRYYDFCAFCRMGFLVSNGLTPAVMQQNHFGPILFREECSFRRELKFGDEVTINARVSKMTLNSARFSMKHEIWKGSDVIAATVHVDIAWMDTLTRKLTVPPQIALDILERAPRTDDFQLITR